MTWYREGVHNLFPAVGHRSKSEFCFISCTDNLGQKGGVWKHTGEQHGEACCESAGA